MNYIDVNNTFFLTVYCSKNEIRFVIVAFLNPTRNARRSATGPMGLDFHIKWHFGFQISMPSTLTPMTNTHRAEIILSQDKATSATGDKEKLLK